MFAGGPIVGFYEIYRTKFGGRKSPVSLLNLFTPSDKFHWS